MTLKQLKSEVELKEYLLENKHSIINAVFYYSIYLNLHKHAEFDFNFFRFTTENKVNNDSEPELLITVRRNIPTSR